MKYLEEEKQEINERLARYERVADNLVRIFIFVVVCTVLMMSIYGLFCANGYFASIFYVLIVICGISIHRMVSWWVGK